MLQALLAQRSEGRLTGSALETWVDRWMETACDAHKKRFFISSDIVCCCRFEVYHSQAFSGRDEEVERQFQALNKYITTTNQPQSNP